MNYWKISEFNISGQAIPEDVADKILTMHIEPMNRVQDLMIVKVWPSLKSGYRSRAWEIEHGREGNSQHVFRGDGAVDWTCVDFSLNKADLLDLIIKHTDYTRMAIYNGFIHCDYAGIERWVYNQKWVKQYQV